MDMLLQKQQTRAAKLGFFIVKFKDAATNWCKS